MNIEIKDISETRKSLLVALDKNEVDTEYRAVVGEVAKLVRLPGFRPGRAPVDLVVKRFGKEVQDEFRSKVVGRAYREGLREAKLDVISLVKVDQEKIERGLPSAITFTIDVRPSFEPPEYIGLPTQVQATEATDAEIDSVIDNLRQERADFRVAARAAQKGDFVKLGYTGTVDGRQINELVPGKQIYGQVPQTWEEVEGAQEGLLPGLGRQLAGVKAGDKKDVSIKFPVDFAPAPGLAGKNAVYALDIQEVRERALPPMDSEFFKAHQAENLDALRAQIRQNLKMRKEYENRRLQRQQVSEALAARIEIPLPESLLAAETQVVLRRFLEERLRSGVPEADLEKNKKELYDGARRAAAGRVKLQLILAKIAEKEKIQATERDIDGAIMREAVHSNQRPEKIAKDLTKDRERLRALQQSVIFDKALDFLVGQAIVTTAPSKT
ncbi:MAG: trigger factor [Verrucomicrobia bacterium RIFCSPLOWO2_12_FULL_64_8]|nr:MAG: trigger factor [Verrucomicrobia bacterium RIFCSPLOWO2_12_FULL_64_8]